MGLSWGGRPATGPPGSLPSFFRLVLGSLAVAGATMLLWGLLRPTGASLAPLWTQLVGWPLVALVGSTRVQLRLGGGRLDNRVTLRLCLGLGLFALMVLPWGYAFVFPLYATLVASHHLQWSGHRIWTRCALLTAGLTVGGQVGIQLGWFASATPAGVSAVAAACALVAALATVANLAHVVAEREEDARTLEAERRARHDELLHAATHDALTGLLDRAGLRAALAEALGSTGPGRATAVLFLDLDGFKAVNDRLGHAAGDLLLVSVAQRLTGAVRPGDAVARLGGDEFVVLLRAVADPAAVERTAERVEAALAEPFDLDGTATAVRASAGTASTEDPATVPDALLDEADRGMYAVKRTRHAAVVPF